MEAGLFLEDIKRSEGVSPEKNAFIERILRRQIKLWTT
jgi:hypothetical protein